MPYKGYDSPDTIGTFTHRTTGGTKQHTTSHGTSTPKSERERKQKEFTSQQVSDMSSELTKANRKLRSGIFNQAQYKEERERIFKKYDITKDERIRFLGKKFAS